MTPKCRKCQLNLIKCKVCKGEGYTAGIAGKLNCNTCDKTGWECPAHGKFWR